MLVSLGIDTSCYTTSAALTDEHGTVIASSRMLLPVAMGQCGLRQSEAVFAHVKQLPAVIDGLFEQVKRAEAQIVCVCASQSPRDEEDSYMPVFQTGLSQASVLAKTLNVPLYRVSHQEGHIAAGWVGNGRIPSSFVALHISGGTTELLCCQNSRIQIIGGSKDLHAGQLVDRVGVAMGLSFPAGAQLERIAMSYSGQTESLLPACMEQGDLFCHLSGAETKVQQCLKNGTMSQEKIAAEVFDFLSRTVARLLAAGCAETGFDTSLVVGGVASSLLLREGVSKRLKKMRCPIKVSFGQPKYSSDNAVGVSVLGMNQYLKEAGQ